MKCFTTLLFVMAWLAVNSLTAQVVLVNSPESIARPYEFSPTSGWGADLLSDVWTGDAEFIDDGTAAPNEGCSAATNDLTGKIALAGRGTCNFSLKALNAQDSGAIAMIIFNNNPGEGTEPMGAGSFGSQVTIPVVMLSYEDGLAIRAALESGPVNISIGNIVFDNDISITDTSIINAPLGIIPLSQIEESGLFSINPGLRVTNTGLNPASGVEVNATITYTPFGGDAIEVYDESASIPGPIDADTASGLLALPPFTPANGQGQYSLNYSTSSDSTDQLSFDNTLARTFTVSENMYSKARWNPSTGNPRVTISRTTAGGGDIEFLSVFNIPEGEGYAIDSVVFFVATNAASLAGITVESYVYEWNDLNEDSLLNNDELSIAGLSIFTFPDDETATSTTLRLPYLNPETFEETGVVIPEDDMDYVVGVRYQGPEIVFFGFDDGYDYTQYQNFKLANGTFTDHDHGFIGISQWNDLIPDVESGFGFTGLGTAKAVSTAVLLKSPEVSTEEVVGEETFRMELFPNPASEKLTLSLHLHEPSSFAEYRITDAAGRLALRRYDTEVFEKEQVQLDISTLPAGQYFLVVRTEQGIQSKPFTASR